MTDLPVPGRAFPARMRRRLILRAFGSQWLFDRLRPYLGRGLLLLALGLLAAALALVPPWLTKLVIDRGLVARDSGALVTWSAALLGVGFVTLGLSSLSNILHMRASVAMLADLRLALARLVLGRSPLWRSGQQAGEIMARLDGDAGEVQQFAFNLTLTGASAVVRLLGGAALLFALNAKLALAAVLLAPFELLFLTWARPKTEAVTRAARAARGDLASRLTEMVQGLMPIQAAGGEGAVLAAIGRAQDGLNRALLRAQVWGEVTRTVPATLAALARAGVVLLGGFAVIDGSLTLGGFVAFLAYLAFLTGPVQSLLGLWQARVRVTAALERIEALRRDPPGEPRWPERPAAMPAGQGALTLDGIPLAGGDTLSVAIPAGTKLRLAGPSGVGKSTLLALLQRHADPGRGQIALDGADIATLARADLRGAVRLVPQRPFLLSGSVAENLTLSAPDASHAAMSEMLALVGLARRLTPESRIGEDGLTLSGGERQRLCLARALLAPFRVLVLDEALSEVDPDSVRRIMGAIDTAWGDRTRIVVSHGAVEAYGAFDRVIDLGGQCPVIRVALIDGPLRPDHPALVRRNVLRPGDTGAAEGGHAAAMAAALLAGCPDARIENLVVFAGGLTTNAACVADAMEDARGADLVLCAFGMTRADPALALATARVLEGGAVIVAAAPARGAPVFPAAFDGVVSVQGDARCGPTDWSRLDLPQARFGACPALAPHPGVAGASVAAAHFAGIVARHIAGGAPGADAIALIARTAPHQGRERRGLAAAPQPG